MTIRLPMFPLGTVLVPHGVLPLHVFEPRYRVLMFDCMRADRRFGVVLIERGPEVGGGDQRFAVATVARIADAAELPDGRWVLIAEGERRVEVTSWLPEDPYPLAEVSERPEATWPAIGEQRRVAEDALSAATGAVRQLLALAGAGESVDAALELAADAPTRAWQLVALAPIEPLDKQRLLEVDDPPARLRALADLAAEREALLRYRLERE